MSSNAPALYGQQFATNVSLLLQQKGSKLRGTVTEGSYKGKQASPVDQMGAIAAQKVVSRFAPMGRVDAKFDRRWVFPQDYDLPQLMDHFDKLRMLTDPTSQYVLNAKNAMGRAMDDEILAGLLGPAKVGETGAQTKLFDTTQTVGVQHGTNGQNVGLTVAKLREAKRILMANEVDFDEEEVTVLVKAKQHDNLLAESQIISLDFNEKPVLQEGRIVRFLGMNIKHIERLGAGADDQAGQSDIIPIYAKSGMHLGIWEDISADVSQRKDLQGLPWQAYVYGTFGATRLEEKKIVRVFCR